MSRKHVANDIGAAGSQVGGDAARHDPVHHQPMAETGGGRAQNLFAQNAALGMHERKRRIVADRADVAEMVRQPFQLRHQRSQIARARRRFDIQRRLDGVRKGDPVGDGGSRRRFAPASRAACAMRRARHQQLDPLVHVAEALLEPHHRFAAAGETEMPRLDDAGVHRADGDLVQRVAFHGQERVSLARGRRWRAVAERMAHVPEAEIEPGPRIRRVGRLVAVKTVDGPLEPDRRRMHGADRRKLFGRAGEADDRDLAGRLGDDRHLHGWRLSGVAPERQQCGTPRGERRRSLAPALRRHHETRPRPVAVGAFALRNYVDQTSHRFQPSSLATF